MADYDALPTMPMAMNFAQLARQIAMDLLDLDDILRLHDLTVEQWERIQADPTFQNTLKDMVTEWNSAGNTKNRIRVKAATGIEAVLEPTLQDVIDREIPLGQRIEAMKFLAKLGELIDQPAEGGLLASDRVSIQIYTGSPDPAVVIEGKPLLPDNSDA